MGYICYLGFFVVLDQLFWGEAVQVAQFGLHHDGYLAQVLPGRQTMRLRLQHEGILDHSSFVPIVVIFTTYLSYSHDNIYDNISVIFPLAVG